MSKLHVLLLFGGESSEHDISKISAHNVYAAIDDTKYDVSLCYIDKVGRWWLTDDIEGNYIGRPQLLPAPGQKKLYYLEHSEYRELQPDVIFPVLHGTNGEDGTIQGLAKLLHLPCVGPGLIDATICMDKDVTKRLLREAGVPVVPWMIARRGERVHYQTFVETLGQTMFVKPSNGGSSVGVHKVENQADFHAALTDAWKYDTIALVEKAIFAREIEVAIIGNDQPKVSEPGEIIPGDTFYSYDDKYVSGSSARIVIPAQLDELSTEKIQSYALQAYRAVEGRGMARVDFFIDKSSGELFLNEINSIPGFTNISMYPKLWHAAGVSYAQLIDDLIRLSFS